MYNRQELNLDPHPADPTARLLYLDQRSTLCWWVMLLSIAVSVFSWLTADMWASSLPLYIYACATAMSGFCALAGSLIDSERNRLKRRAAQ